jgi:metal-responsive CopG/Arc/MetJ family transcriptional regulator
MATCRKIQIVFPHDLLHEVDRLVKGRERSAFVVDATREKLARIRFKAALKGASGAWSAEQHPETRTQRTLARWMKRTRRKTQQRLMRRLRG